MSLGFLLPLLSLVAIYLIAHVCFCLKFMKTKQIENRYLFIYFALVSFLQFGVDAIIIALLVR